MAPKPRATRAPRETPKTVEIFREALAAAEPRPPDDSTERDVKKNYAERLSNKIAVLIANELRKTGQFPGILPNPDGTGRESKSAGGASKKAKKTDVRFSTSDTGLELLVSVKTYSFRDAKKNKKTGEVTLGRYTKNVVRNDHELRAEAMDHHDRHPYAVLVAMFFEPFRACEDAGEADDAKSSFAHAVMTFRARVGRARPSDARELFERFFIGLYEPGGEVWFFDVADRPPRCGRPKRQEPKKGEPRTGLLTLEEAIAEIVKAYGVRNQRYIEWADEDATAVPDLAPPPEPTDTGEENEEEE